MYLKPLDSTLIQHDPFMNRHHSMLTHVFDVTSTFNNSCSISLLEPAFRPERHNFIRAI
jgi:hypothetical protein